MSKYIWVDTAALPDYFTKVLDTKKLIESGAVKNVSEAARSNGISRSTYYKYKDYVFENAQTNTEHFATFLLLLNHESGVLSNVLSLFSALGANILTISQSFPIGSIASVTLTAELTDSQYEAEIYIKKASELSGVKQIQLVAIN